MQVVWLLAKIALIPLVIAVISYLSKISLQLELALFDKEKYGIFQKLGVIWHETCHLVVGLLFLHFPTRVQFLNLHASYSEEGETLGQVETVYKRNPYTLLGDTFMGLAPVWVNLVIIYFVLNMFPTNLNYLSGFLDLPLPYLIGMLLFIIWLNSGVFALSDQDWFTARNGILPIVALTAVVWALDYFLKLNIAFNLSNIMTSMFAILIPFILFYLVITVLYIILLYFLIMIFAK